MSELILSHRKRFDSNEEAIEAFYRKELAWMQGDHAYTWSFRKNTSEIVGHKLVKIADVVGISSDGDPVYQCWTRSGTAIQLEADVLMTKQEMLFKADGSPTVYHEWFLRSQAERERRKRRVTKATASVTIRMTY